MEADAGKTFQMQMLSIYDHYKFNTHFKNRLSSLKTENVGGCLKTIHYLNQATLTRTIEEM